jgi:pimeloyl-ACP methyl ester carboxylesterase
MGLGKGVFAAVAAIALVPAVLAGCDGDDDDQDRQPTASVSRPAPGSISFGDLGDCGTLPRANKWRCGSIEVPWERADPSLGTTEIGFAVKVREQHDRPSAGAIFAVEGGPGYASSGTAGSYKRLFGTLLRRRELVLVDMRGTGRSGPLVCQDLQEGRAPEWIALPECADRLGPRFESYRTAAAADDIDDVRRALGYPRITLYGDSYGTFLAQSYAFRHGEHLNSLVLDSAYPAEGEDPWYPSLVRTGIRAFAIACERSPGCSGDPEALLARLVEFLRGTRGVGSLLDALIGAAYTPPQSYLRIHRAGAALLRGRVAAWSRLTDPGQAVHHRPRRYSRGEELVVGCNDYPMIWDKEASEHQRRRQLERAIRTYDEDAFLPFTPREVALAPEMGYLECLTWPRPTELYESPIPNGAEPPDVPVLVVSGELDDLTTPWEGRVVAEQFPQGRQFVARNVGHVHALYYAGGAAAVEIREFLRDVLGS